MIQNHLLADDGKSSGSTKSRSEARKKKCNLCFSSRPLSGGLKVTCEYMAQQEGVLCEEVLLLSETEDVCVKVKVHARVMGEATVPYISDRKQKTYFLCFVFVAEFVPLPPPKK